MHIALVSSHYPPNFVSGGTLVPQRIAEGFAARGHRVSVFAGSFEDGAAGPDRPARDLPQRRADPVDHHHRHADLGGRRQLRQRRRRCRVLPLAGPHPAGRGAFPQPAGHGRLVGLDRIRIRRLGAGHHARHVVVVRPAVPGRSRPAAVRVGRRLRDLPVRTQQRLAGRPEPPTLRPPAQRRPRPGAVVDHGRPAVRERDRTRPAGPGREPLAGLGPARRRPAAGP